MEAELFGYERGAFTGAVARRDGRFSLAHNGSLFLDEVGEISPQVQVKLLRVLQEGEFERLGGRTVKVDLRLVAATNKDLELEIKNNNFREDLFYRLNVVPIHVPSLQDRVEDIPPLVDNFLNQFRDKGLGEKQFADDALAMLMRHSWPGNVRELRNMVERLVIMTPDQLITAADVAIFLSPGSAQPVSTNAEALYSHLGFKEARRQFEHDYLKTKLEQNKGNVSRTAEKVGMERSHLHKKVKALGIVLD